MVLHTSDHPPEHSGLALLGWTPGALLDGHTHTQLLLSLCLNDHDKDQLKIYFMRILYMRQALMVGFPLPA